MKQAVAAALASLFATGATAAWAHDSDDGESGSPLSHWWFGLGDADLTWSAGATLGSNSFHDWNLISDDGSFTSSSEDRADVGVRVHAGLDFLKHFGVELGHADLGEVSFRAQSDGTGGFFDAGPIAASTSAQATDLTLIGRLDLGVDTAITARVGMLRWEVNQRFTGSFLGVPTDVTDSDKGGDLQYGIAAEYRGLKAARFALGYSRAELDVEAFLTDQITLSSFRLSATYLFDRARD